MAQKPLNQAYVQANLPANLSEDWINDDFLMADNLTNPESGYNYLNKQVNNAQESVALINEAFEDLASMDYVETITGLNESVLQHASDTTLHSSSAEKEKWNREPVVYSWSLGEDVDIDKTYASGMMLDTTTSVNWTNVNSANLPASFSVPFAANIVAIVSIDCQGYGTASGNHNNGIGVRFTFNRGFGNSIVKYRALKAAGVDFLSAPTDRQQIRGNATITEVFHNQPANTAINLNLAHKRIASDWGQSVHIGGRSVTYIAYPV